MSRFPKLTEHQREPLFALVDYQKQENVLVIYGGQGGWQTTLTPWQDGETMVTKVDTEVIALWEHCGYVTLGSRQVGPATIGFDRVTLILREEAFAYADRMGKLWLIRNLLNIWDGLSADVKTAVFGGMAAVLTTLILKGLGFVQ